MNVKMEKVTLFDIFLYVILSILSFVMLYPVVYMFSLSFSDSAELAIKSVSLLPRGFSTAAYIYVANDSRILLAYANTLLYTTLGTFISILISSLLAFPLSIKTFCMKKLYTILLVVTMFFSGGLIPFYMTVRMLHMIDTIWVIVIPGAVSAWNVIIYKTFFRGLPESLRESAHLDGANDFRILFSIILPLSKPLLATMALFSIVGIWNDYFTALIFLNNAKMYPMQLILRAILVYSQMINENTGPELSTNIKYRALSIQTIQASLVVVSVLPIMCLYPFLQKYFIKGAVLGSLKG